MNKSYLLNKSIEYQNRIKRYLPGGAHYNFHAKSHKNEICFSKGYRSRLWDLDGNEYLDLAGKSGALILGHNHKEYMHVLSDCLRGPTAVDTITVGEEVCRKLSRYVPCCEMVRFGLSGTEVVQNALRLARAYTKKRLIIKFEGHFHGSADNIMVNQYDTEYVPYDDGSSIFSTAGRDNGIFLNQVLVIPWNNINIVKDVIARYHNEVAAVITEPVCINGGGIMPEENFLSDLRQVCSDNGIVLIFDEMITGIRLGLGGAQEKYKVVPDLCLLGKSLAGGSLPASAICGKRDIMKLYEEGTVVHAGTFNGYPLGLAAINATLDIISQNADNYYQNMKAIALMLYEVIMEQAQKSGIELIIQGPEACSVMNCNKTPINNYKSYGKKTIGKNGVLYDCFKNYGIILASPTKLYPNMVMDIEDVEFVKERVKIILDSAALILNRVKFKD
jgi:glutamate-1-semialdehyde 2,1-aminomutase